MRALIRLHLIVLFLFAATSGAMAMDYSVSSLGDWEAFKINNYGTVIGYVRPNAADYVATVWNSETGLSTLGSSLATTGINDSGQIVGNRWIDGAWHAFILEGGAEREIGIMWVDDINNEGTVVGTRFENDWGRQHLFLWNNGSLLRDQIVYGTAMALNDQEEVVGRTNWDTALLWDAVNGERSGPALMAMDINNRGQIVGSAWVNGWLRPFIWDSVNGLQSITLPNIPENKHCVAYGINDSGVIVGQIIGGDGDNSRESIMWTPVPEPAPLISLLIGLLLLGWHFLAPGRRWRLARP